ncbi:MAG: hypothetical protein E6I57_06975 [Chloroflexi bacterium]|nr:MAG: hypothetical protein E6J49_04310 [Chloroflexota bacterium]TMC30746.1 MAG: hypothetical protein E6J27_02235 [Chloroflexota bacterium]TMC33451.1 MAG: hypothetical protein E6J24_09785 [Chloroflexota bacterium]TMC58933.1 MAG: hypothetical protein E6J19_01385 [Chloroflexota bacterium]TME39590.1 MAG: hypothetical protein E6I57_06975 [Chloroflexota bacterium]
MRRLALAFLLTMLAVVPFGGTALAKCPTCLDGVSLQTPDGQPWSTGKPVTLVVSARRGAPGTEFPTTGLAVVMRTDGDRTKCLDVPLRLVKTGGDSALYAGVFYPFRAAAYDGKLSLGDQTFDISFDVNKLVATTPVASAQDLPVGSTEEAYGLTLSDAIGIAPMVGLAALAWIAIAWFANRRTLRLGFAS